MAAILDTLVELTLRDSNTADQETRRLQGRDQGRVIARTWLAEEMAKIRNDHINQLTDLLTRLHERCIERVKTAILDGYSEPASRITGNMRVVMDEIIDLRASITAKEGIATAFAMFDDTRQQAVASYDRTVRIQIQAARSRALTIESDISAISIVENLVSSNV